MQIKKPLLPTALSFGFALLSMFSATLFGAFSSISKTENTIVFAYKQASARNQEYLYARREIVESGSSTHPYTIPYENCLSVNDLFADGSHNLFLVIAENPHLRPVVYDSLCYPAAYCHTWDLLGVSFLEESAKSWNYSSGNCALPESLAKAEMAKRGYTTMDELIGQPFCFHTETMDADLQTQLVISNIYEENDDHVFLRNATDSGRYPVIVSRGSFVCGVPQYCFFSKTHDLSRFHFFIERLEQLATDQEFKLRYGTSSIRYSVWFNRFAGIDVEATDIATKNEAFFNSVSSLGSSIGAAILTLAFFLPVAIPPLGKKTRDRSDGFYFFGTLFLSYGLLASILAMFSLRLPFFGASLIAITPFGLCFALVDFALLILVQALKRAVHKKLESKGSNQ